mmetsp:Transcript_11545/g.21178  ORF Transcript_11545/g.21178 Transcript_11545/m.21178 type:complete len:93 (-) Transcript_11545:25-303(-)
MNYLALMVSPSFFRPMVGVGRVGVGSTRITLAPLCHYIGRIANGIGHSWPLELRSEEQWPDWVAVASIILLVSRLCTAKQRTEEVLVCSLTR